MKKFLAVYTGSAQARQDSGWDTLEPDERNKREQQGMAAWGAWMDIHAASHEEAAGLFADHPHFCIFPGEGVEVMECLPVPGQ